MNAILRPMLAASAETEEDLATLLTHHKKLFMSEKVDGICGLKGSDGWMYGRSGDPVINTHVQKAFKDIPRGFHGEITFAVDGCDAARPALELVESVVNSKSDQWPRRWQPRFFCFDFQHPGSMPFSARRERLLTYRSAGISNLIIHRQLPATELTTILSFFGYVVDTLEGEGIVLRAADAPYKQNRSTLRDGCMVRYKRISRDTATIIGYEALQRHVGAATDSPFGLAKRDKKASNRKEVEELGAWIVTNEKYGEFKVGSGFTDALRKLFWKDRHGYIGDTLRYFHRDTTHLNKPRNPTFDKILTL